jgi:translation initiation factor 2B subunit (eIF-2B alpha/beta/delta family)
MSQLTVSGDITIFTKEQDMRDVQACIVSVRDDRKHGSRWLVRQTVQILYELATEAGVAPQERLRRVRQAGGELAQARPAMAAIAGACWRVLAASGGPEALARAAHQFLQEYDQAMGHLCVYARAYMQGTIMTHSLSGTVLEVIKLSVPTLAHVIILEGRPLYEGRTVAGSLADQQLKLTLITDAQADIFLPLCQAVIVGADSILADGSILNKAGTALLARAAQSQGVPFYVVSETLKVSPHAWSGDLALLEEHCGQEVWRDAPLQVTVRNFSFDRTPAELVSGIITEQGLLGPGALARQAQQLREVAGLE